jgi:hypothetical protein
MLRHHAGSWQCRILAVAENPSGARITSSMLQCHASRSQPTTHGLTNQRVKQKNIPAAGFCVSIWRQHDTRNNQAAAFSITRKGVCHTGYAGAVRDTPKEQQAEEPQISVTDPKSYPKGILPDRGDSSSVVFGKNI